MFRSPWIIIYHNLLGAECKKMKQAMPRQTYRTWYLKNSTFDTWTFSRHSRQCVVARCHAPLQSWRKHDRNHSLQSFVADARSPIASKVTKDLFATCLLVTRWRFRYARGTLPLFVLLQTFFFIFLFLRRSTDALLFAARPSRVQL